MGRLYRGHRTEQGCVVQVYDGAVWEELDPRYDLRSHSPDGYEWGYGGSGPAQLALALLADALQRDRLAEWWYQDYKRAVVCGLPREGWDLTQESICRWVVEQVRQELLGDQPTHTLIV